MKIKTLFILQRSSLFSSYKYVISEIANKQEIWDAPKFTIAKWLLDGEDECLNNINQLNEYKYFELPIISNDEALNEKDSFDFIFVQLPYLHLNPNEFSISNLKSRCKKVIYIQYFFIDWGYKLYQIEHLQNFDLIFCHSNYEKQRYIKYNQNINESCIVISGSPKIDTYYQNTEKFRNNNTNKEKTVLWTPHWGVHPDKNESTSSFSEYFTEIFNYFSSESCNHKLIFRPHPLLFQQLVNSGLMSMVDINGLLSFINKSEKIKYDCSPQCEDSFASADILLCDATGMMMEFIHTEKPIVYLEIPNKYNNIQYGSNNSKNHENDMTIIKSFYTCFNFHQAINFIEKLAIGYDPKKVERKKAIFEYFSHLGIAGKNIVQLLEIEHQNSTYQLSLENN